MDRATATSGLLRFGLDADTIAAFCRRHHIAQLSLFGSVARGDSRPDSDVDVLVEFEPDHVPGLFGLAGMELELSDAIGRRVDLRTAEDLSPYFRDQVVAAAQPLYVA